MRALPVLAAFLLTACATTPSVRTDFDPAVNFQSYRTYHWAPVDVPRGMNPLMFRRVQAAIDQSLHARGYTQANPGDFTIGFTVGEKDRVEVHDYGWGGYGGYGGWGPGWGWGGWGGGGFGGWGYPYGWGSPYSSIDVYNVTERSLVIDIYDTKTNLPVWHGVAKKDAYTDDVNYTKLDETIAAVLGRFPPQPGVRY